MSQPKSHTDLTTLPTSVCSCNTCKKACDRPCWPTPAEANKLMDAGYAKRLMLDWWEADERVYLLCGANPGKEGTSAEDSLSDIIASVMGKGTLNSGCTFYTSEGLCELHDINLKPIEGRLYHHSGNSRANKIHETVASLWDSEDGRFTVNRWKELVK